MEVSTTKMCLDTSILAKSIMGRREYLFLPASIFFIMYGHVRHDKNRTCIDLLIMTEHDHCLCPCTGASFPSDATSLCKVKEITGQPIACVEALATDFQNALHAIMSTPFEV
jgi:hypothetical protein